MFVMKNAILIFVMSFLFLNCGGNANSNSSESGTGTSCCDSTENSNFENITSFLTNPTDQFMVDMDVVRNSTPYYGENSQNPHTGGHIYFNENLSQTKTYPDIYAIADGVVDRVDTYFEQSTGNYRYGVSIQFAEDSDGNSISFHYSIEPMINPNDTGFYEQFLFVAVGDVVSKGDVIAKMYLPEGSEYAHIHFNLNHETKGFQTPSIFTQNLIDEYHDHSGINDDETLDACMGYDLADSENPFATDLLTCL